MPRKYVIHSEDTVNQATGEVLTTKKTMTFTSKSSDEFFMIFIKFISGFFDLRSAIDMKILIKFCMMSDFNTGMVLIPAGLRKELLVEFGIENSHLSNSIARLKKANLITGEQGKYALNPIVAWKGDIKTRDLLIKEKGLEFKMNFVSEEFN
jgi:hypothetical protein